MSVLQSIPLSADALKMRWEEPFVTAGLNTKNLAVHPKGVLVGFRVVPSAGFVVTVQVDPGFSLSIANVFDSTNGNFSVTVVQNANINIDLTAQANSTVYIALDVQYVIGANTTGQVKVVDAAELGTNVDLVVLAKVNVPSIGPIISDNINMGYRLSAGDITPMEAFQALNLITNPGFETNSISAWTNNGFDTAAASTDTAHTGTYSLKLIKTVAGAPFIAANFIGVVPGRRYKAGAWVRSTGGSPIVSGNGAKVQVSWFDASGALIGTPVTIETAFSGGGTTWTQKLAEVIAPALTATAQMRVFFDGSSGTLYVDDVQFVTYFNDSLVQTTALALSYAGGSNWADGTTNPPTPIENQLDKIITDLSGQIGTGGAGKIGFTPLGNISSNRVDTAIHELDLEKAGLALNNTFSGNNIFNGTGTYNNTNTFNNGITVLNGVGISSGNLTFTAITQKVAWPTVSMREEASHQLGFYDSTTLYADLITDVGHDASHLRLYGAAMTGIISMDSTIPALQIRSDTFTSTPIEFHTNAVKRWQIKGTGELASIGGPRAIQSVLDPVTAQDAATLHSNTVLSNLSPPQNYVLNSSMEFQQRAGLTYPSDAGLALQTAPSYAFRSDRWYAFIDSGSGANTQNYVFWFFTIPFNGIKRTSGVDTNVAKRSLVYEVEYDQVGLLAISSGSFNVPLTLQCGVFVGSGTTGTLVVKIYQGNSGVFASGYAAQSLCFTSTSLIAGGTFQFLIPGGSLPGSAQRLAIVFEWTPTANPAVANEFFAVKDVMLCMGDRTPGGAILAPNRACPTIELEYFALLRYYEKSYRYEDAPGASTTVSQWRTICGAVAVPNGQVFKMPHVRYLATKNAGGTVKLWSTTGVANQWEAASVAGTVVSSTNASAHGFELTNNSGGTITPATNAVEMAGHWEVSCEVGEF